MLERSGANHERAIGHSLRQALHAFRVLEQVRGADGRLRFAPVGLIRSDHGHAREAEVGHGPRRGSYIEGIARRDEDDVELVALGFGEQRPIPEATVIA
jgi:hypothetical protein